MSKNLIIIGAGGHARVIADMAMLNGYKIIGFLDDNQMGYVSDIPIIGAVKDISKYTNECQFIIGIGNNSIRANIAKSYNAVWATIIHPTAVIARNVEISCGTVIMAYAVINTGTLIGKHCIINTAAVIEHDNKISDYVHVSPNATLCGTVSIGTMCHIGAGVIVKNNISICDGCTVGIGAAVVKDISIVGTYIGIPARMMK